MLDSRDTDLLARLRRHAATGHTALVVAGSEELTYRELYGRVEHRVARMEETVPPAAPVAVCASEPAEVIAWTLAALVRDSPVLMGPPDMPGSQAMTFARSQGAIAVVTPEGAALTATGAPVGPAGATGPGVHFYTSGTSGTPRRMAHSLQALTAEAVAVATVLGYGRRTRVLCPVPIGHAYGFVLGVLAPVYAGSTLVVARPLTRRQFAAVLERHAPHVVIGVPKLYAMWSAGSGTPPAVGLAADLRLCVSAGSPLPVSTAHDFLRTWGKRIVQQYGSSECGAVTVNLDLPERPDCAGRPYPGVQLTAGTERTPGPILVRSPFAAEDFADGEVDTGDLGWLDDEGRLYISGRRSDLISVHGRKIDPREVEGVLARHAKVRETAVVGIEADDADEWVAAFVVGDDALTEVELFSHCRDWLAPYKVPRRFFFLDAIPRNEMGKVRAAELAERGRAQVRGGADR